MLQNMSLPTLRLLTFWQLNKCAEEFAAAFTIVLRQFSSTSQVSSVCIACCVEYVRGSKEISGTTHGFEFTVQSRKEDAVQEKRKLKKITNSMPTLASQIQNKYKPSFVKEHVC